MPQPNIIVIMTDDQRADFLTHAFMPRTTQRLVDGGVNFTNAFATTALCGPSRAGFLSGQLASVHGVHDNLAAQVFVDTTTLATRLHDAGYYTALVGKYLNGYETLGPPTLPTWRIPPGWDTWVALQQDFDSYLDATFITGASTTEHVTQYTTDWIATRAKFVLDHKPANTPFFLLCTPFGPHLGLEMQPERYAGVMLSEPAWRPPNFNEADVSDKAGPMPAKPLISDTGSVDTNRRAMLEALLAVDDLVEVLWRVARTIPNTLMVFASDNGFLLGEHRLTAKNMPYDEAHRIPLALWYPGVLAPRVEPGLVTMQDVTQTLCAWAGAAPLGTGISMLQALTNQPQNLARTVVPLEGYGTGAAYTGLRTTVMKYIAWTATAEAELYDLTVDPYELASLL